MKYILSQDEYDALREEQRVGLEAKKAELQKLATAAAKHITDKHAAKPEPVGERAELIREYRETMPEGALRLWAKEAAALLEAAAKPAEQAKGHEAVAHFLYGFVHRKLDGTEVIVNNDDKRFNPLTDRPVYTMERTTPPAQPAREWVGLSDEDCEQLALKEDTRHFNGPTSNAYWFHRGIRAAESKLREKNS